ncbi:hypothetical protein G6F35_015744 [Rhizopus arrhizus]|nr:hypothetical protein G6F35_015744 [Rhizopus arrhizus]
MHAHAAAQSPDGRGRSRATVVRRQESVESTPPRRCAALSATAAAGVRSPPADAGAPADTAGGSGGSNREADRTGRCRHSPPAGCRSARQRLHGCAAAPVRPAAASRALPPARSVRPRSGPGYGCRARSVHFRARLPAVVSPPSAAAATCAGGRPRGGSAVLRPRPRTGEAGAGRSSQCRRWEPG